MAEQEETAEVTDKAKVQADELKKRLLRRAIVAGVMIVALIGGLALFDRMSKPVPEEPAAPPAAPISPPPPPPPPPAPATEPPPPPPAEAEKPPEAPPEQKPAAEQKPPAEQKPSAERKQPSARKPAIEEKPVAEPEKTVSPLTVPPPEPAPVTRGGAKKAEEKGPPPAPPVVERARPGMPVSGYAVQMGVFSTVENAEELRARLALQGIPAHIESRVIVGPFGTKKEAEAAQTRLRALKLDAGMLVPFKSK